MQSSEPAAVQPIAKPKHIVVDNNALRLQSTLQIGGAAAVVYGLGWGLVFLIMHDWQIVAVQCALVALGLLTISLSRRALFSRTSTILLIYALFSLLCVTTAFLDTPTATIPRTNHHFFLVVGILSYMMLSGEPSKLKFATLGLSFAAFYFFATTSWGVSSAHQLPDSIRWIAPYVNTGIALLLLLFLLQVLQTDTSAYALIVSDLRKGLASDQFSVHFQPQVDAQGRISGAEALVRWRHPELGMVPPSEFIPAAEESGLILPLGHWVLDKACHQLSLWSQHEDMDALTISVNVSAKQLQQADFVDQTRAVLVRHGINPSRLKLELTETTLAYNMKDISAKMQALKKFGVAFSLDDFGTGYCSLNYLQQLPLDQIKIDRSFICNAMDNPGDAAIISTLIKLSNVIGIEIIAEGVETSEQQLFLAGLGCPTYQGYLMSKPLTITDFNRLVQGNLASIQANNA